MEAFFRALRSANVEAVSLFLEAGMPPDARDETGTPAVLVASREGCFEIAKLLLARGAPPEALIVKGPPRKDAWDKLAASAAVLSFISSVAIAGVGGYFTYSYNQRQIDLNRTQAEHDGAAKEQSNKVLELEAIQKLIPTLASKDEQQKAAALIAVQDLAHADLAAHLAVLFKGQGSVQYLRQAAESQNAGAKHVAVQALSQIASSTKDESSALAVRALSDVFKDAKASLVKVRTTGGRIFGSGMVINSNGTILTAAHLFRDVHEGVSIVTSDGQSLSAELLAIDNSSDLAVVKTTMRPNAVPALRLRDGEPELATPVSAMGYAGDEFTVVTGAVSSISFNSTQDFVCTCLAQAGMSGGPVINNSGFVIGMIHAGMPTGALAVKSEAAIVFLRSHQLATD